MHTVIKNCIFFFFLFDFRAGLIGLTSAKSLNELDLATAGACCAALSSGNAVEIIRVHNVKDVHIVCSTFCRLRNV